MTGVDAGRHRGAHARTAGRTGERADAVPGSGSAPGTGRGASGKPRASGAPGARASGTVAGRSLAERLLVPVIPGILGLITGVYHLGVPPLWRDEAATKAIASRSVGQILATMPHDDVVHGAYYLVVHVFIRLFGSSNGALRLPSAIAAAVACAVTALVAQRLAAGGGRGGAFRRGRADRGDRRGRARAAARHDQVRPGGALLRDRDHAGGDRHLPAAARGRRRPAALVGRLWRGGLPHRPVQHLRAADRGGPRADAARHRPGRAWGATRGQRGRSAAAARQPGTTDRTLPPPPSRSREAGGCSGCRSAGSPPD